MRPIPAMMTVAVIMAACMGVAIPTTAEAQVRANAQQPRVTAPRQSGRNLPPSGRYVSESGENFIFDRSGQRPLFRFERRTETWVLRATPAPRGDIIYRNDTGDQILRVTPDGGMTLYTVRAPNGTPASMAGSAPTLAVPALGPARLFNLIAQRSALVSRAMGRLIKINLPDVQNEALCVEALMVTTEAVVRMARTPSFERRLSRLNSITIVEGNRSAATYSRGELRIILDSDQGIAGRPSSSRIIRAFGEAT